jgi:hypothetical protein
VCSNLAEGEAAETQVWLKFALSCGYVNSTFCTSLNRIYDDALGKLVTMINQPEKWKT